MYISSWKKHNANCCWCSFIPAKLYSATTRGTAATPLTHYLVWSWHFCLENRGWLRMFIVQKIPARYYFLNLLNNLCIVCLRKKACSNHCSAAARTTFFKMLAESLRARKHSWSHFSNCHSSQRALGSVMLNKTVHWCNAQKLGYVNAIFITSDQEEISVKIRS